MGRYGTKLLLFSAGHFLVDFFCAVLMFSAVSGSGSFALYLLIYNFCAFAMQMPLGLMADYLSRNSIVAGVGCVMVALAWLLSGSPLAAAITAGLGNALFHVGGGVDVLNHSQEKSAALGIFVSPGAFGIYLGTILGRSGSPFHATAAIVALLIAGTALILADRLISGTLRSGNAPVNPAVGRDKLLLVLLPLFLVVCLRSYLGMIWRFDWKSEWHWGIILICAVVFGKTLGGFLADKIGARRAGTLSLGLSAILFLFSDHPVWGVAAILLFNMSMPITLWEAARQFPGAKGFAFGLLTFALFLGCAPVLLGYESPLTTPLSYAIGATVSMLLLRAALTERS